MKTWHKWLIGIVTSLVMFIGIGVIYQMNRAQQLKEEMIKIVESEEAKTLFESELKYLDEKALTEQGKIKSYKVDYDSLKKNPMGGFSVNLIINRNNDTYLRLRLGVYDAEGTVEIASTKESKSLKQLLDIGE